LAFFSSFFVDVKSVGRIENTEVIVIQATLFNNHPFYSNKAVTDKLNIDSFINMQEHDFDFFLHKTVLIFHPKSLQLIENFTILSQITAFLNGAVKTFFF
jgi:hypothetical protein